MKVGGARDAARQWVIEDASGIPGFHGAYTAGSTNWLDCDDELTLTSDVDIMVVVSGPDRPLRRSKFRYRGFLLEASYLSGDQFGSPELVLGDYHLAPGFQTAQILLDPSGQLTTLQATVDRDFAKRHWVLRRCAHARDRALEHLRPVDCSESLHDQVIACLFGAGIATHVLLTAGLRNPTVRTRYVAVRDLLAEYGRLAFHEELLELSGFARMSRGQVARHLATLTDIFDAACRADKSAFPFASDLSEIARPITIDGSLDLIERGYHREAMFWIAVSHSRCQQVLGSEAPADPYRDLLADLGSASTADIRRRCAEIESFLPRVWGLAGEIIEWL